MATLLVGYDLNKPGQRYGRLSEAIKNLGPWWHDSDSTWLVKTALTPVQARDQLKRLIDAGDELLVLDVTAASWAGAGLKQRAYDWLKEQL